MNKPINVSMNNLKDGIETPLGTLCAVENPNKVTFPGISIFIQEDKDEPASLLATVECCDGQLRVLSYPMVHDYDAEPEINNFDFTNVGFEQEEECE